DWLRGRVAADIQVLHHVSPLVEAGLATVTTKALAFCREHIPEVIKSGGTQRAARALRSEFGPKLRIVQESDSPIQVIRVEGPEALLEHGSEFIVRPQSEPLSLGRANRFGHRPLIGASRKQAIDSLIPPIIEDLIQASAHSRAQRLTYLTNREADVAALNAANPPD